MTDSLDRLRRQRQPRYRGGEQAEGENLGWLLSFAVVALFLLHR